ncbi:MAG: amino acid permease [Chlamydiota bacterium]
MKTKQRRLLGGWILTALVVGNMVGSGVFLLPATLAQYGTISLFSWGITALGALFLALVFAKLVTLFPKTGGPYIYCRESFGPFIGFQVAYNYWIYIWIGNAAIAVTFTAYLTAFWPGLADQPALAFWLAAGAIWFFTVVNIIGVRFAGVLQLILTLLKFAPLILISLLGLFSIDVSNLKAFNVSGLPHSTALLNGAMLTLWAFLGLESAVIPADDVKNPKKTIPRATIWGTLLTAVVYMISTVAVMGVIPSAQLQASVAPFADLAGALFGPVGQLVIGAVAVISCLGALNGWILLQGQIPVAAARDELFPARFGQLSKRHSPTFGIVLSSALATLLLLLNFHQSLTKQFTFMISLATLAALIAYLYTAAAEFAIYLKHPDKMERATIVQSLIVAALAFAYAFWALVGAGQETVFYGILLTFTSIPVYSWMQWRKYRLQKT